MISGFKQGAVLFACCAGILMFNAGAVRSEVDLKNPIIDLAAVERQSAHFQFSEEGELIGGPIRAVGEPIDYSSLITQGYLRSAFVFSLLTCFEELQYCDEGVFRWPSKSQSMKVFEERGTMTHEDYETLSKTLRYSLAAIGIGIAAEADVNKASLVVHIGRFPYLRKTLRDKSDKFGLQALDDIGAYDSDMSVPELLKYLIFEEQPFCYTSTKERKTKGQVTIYLNKEGLETCFANALMAYAGLNPSGFDLPSVSDMRLKYKASTLGDVLFARLLYHEDFPVDGSEEEIEQFWMKHANRIRTDLLHELDLRN
ncbi:hypothetical protein K3X41_09530 [Aliiroseovarius crassostreae]|uniref:hypothetical protein n=1 Tax=Aliiroseovarius crassostreae TaxID=154981 RepID=UPI00220CDC75|nr:hypothetical protein [Aliiroseovarius crassostreae]UWQ10171.1 hypothetical protein K3X41_09530 [Aliiroseovarius crassostreae]